MRVFKLKVSLGYFLESLSALALLFLKEFAQRKNNKRWHIFLILAEQLFELFLSHAQ